MNLRGSDIEYNPVFFSYVILTLNEVHLFIDENKLSPSVREHFTSEEINITTHPYEAMSSYLTELINTEKGRIWLCNTSNYGIHSKVPAAQKLVGHSPIAEMKAVKNETEIKGKIIIFTILYMYVKKLMSLMSDFIAGLIDCHIRDGAALCCYFSWLERNIGKQVITEVSGAEKLEEFRKCV